MVPKRVVVLATGGGSTYKYLNEWIGPGTEFLDAEVVKLVASRNGIGAIEVAGMSGTNHCVVDRRDYKGRLDEYWQALLSQITSPVPDLVLQLGWLPLTPKEVIDALGDKLFNLHNSAIDPGYRGIGGRGAHGMASHCIATYVAKRIGRPFATAATIQYVHEKFDRGEMATYVDIPIERSDSVGDVEDKVRATERELVVQFVQDFAAGKINRSTPAVRPERLFERDEFDLLDEAFEVAKDLFPNG